MEIKRMPSDDPAILETAPRDIFDRERKQKTDLFAFGGFQEDQLSGYILMEHDPDSEVIKLEYVYTVPERRGLGIARDLIKHCAAFFEKRHKEYIGCRILRTPEEIILPDVLLTRAGFLPIALLDRIFLYDSLEVLEAEEDFDELREPEDVPFLAEHRGKVVHILIDEAEPMENAALAGRLFSTLHRLEERIGDDFRLALQFTKPETFRQLTEILGEPLEQYQIHDYCLFLGEKMNGE